MLPVALSCLCCCQPGQHHELQLHAQLPCACAVPSSLAAVLAFWLSGAATHRRSATTWRRAVPEGAASAVQGDWGTQFGMLIEHLNETRSGGLADPSIADMSIAELQVGFALPGVAAQAVCRFTHECP